jgi:hypothetical protein
MFWRIVLALWVSHSVLRAEMVDKLSGVIAGKWRFQMTLQVDGTKMIGTYYYDRHLQDIRLTGELSDAGSRLVLTEYAADGQPSGTFDIRVDPAVLATEKLFDRQALLKGTWRKLPDGKPQAVMLDHTGSCRGEIGNLYGEHADEAANGRMLAFWKALKAGDKTTVAASILYPLRVKVGNKPRVVKSAAELTKVYSQVFRPDYVADVANFPPRNLWMNYQGIMLGHGHVWFNQDGRVICINN